MRESATNTAANDSARSTTRKESYLSQSTRARSAGADQTALADELLDEARRPRREPVGDTTTPLSIEATVTLADGATAVRLRQRQLSAIVRLLRHAVAMRQPE